MENSEPQESVVSEVDSLEQEMEEAVRQERERIILEGCQAGDQVEMEDYPTAPASGDKNERWVLDPDGILVDIEKMDAVTQVKVLMAVVHLTGSFDIHLAPDSILDISHQNVDLANEAFQADSRPYDLLDSFHRLNSYCCCICSYHHRSFHHHQP